jgi:hypothetical protein
MVEVELAVATPAQSPGICGAWKFQSATSRGPAYCPGNVSPLDSRGERQRAGEEELSWTADLGPLAKV